MKRSVVAFFALLALLAFPVVSAAQISMASNFSQGETLLAQVSGNFLDQIQQKNVLLYEGHIRIPFTPTVNKADDVFYIYGQLGKSPGNYSLVVSGVRHFEGGTLSSEDIAKNFTISNASADFSVSPGFVFAAKDFSINLENLGDFSVSVEYSLKNASFSSAKQGLVVPAGQSKSALFSVENFSSGSYFAVLSSANNSYEIPIFLSLPSYPQNESNATVNESQGTLEIQPSSLNVSLSTNSTAVRYIYLSNPLANSTNATLFISSLLKPYLSLENNTIELAANSSQQVKINITSLENNTLVDGQITVVFKNSSKIIPVTLNFSSSYVFTNKSGNESQNGNSLFETCVQLAGIKCGENQTCSGESQNALDGKCCLGTCQAKPNPNSGKILGWTLAAIVVLGLVLFFIFRYQKAKRPFNLMNFARRTG